DAVAGRVDAEAVVPVGVDAAGVVDRGVHAALGLDAGAPGAADGDDVAVVVHVHVAAGGEDAVRHAVQRQGADVAVVLDVDVAGRRIAVQAGGQAVGNRDHLAVVDDPRAL